MLINTQSSYEIVPYNNKEISKQIINKERKKDKPCYLLELGASQSQARIIVTVKERGSDRVISKLQTS
jgi:hypothetical protein